MDPRTPSRTRPPSTPSRSHPPSNRRSPYHFLDDSLADVNDVFLLPSAPRSPAQPASVNDSNTSSWSVYSLNLPANAPSHPGSAPGAAAHTQHTLQRVGGRGKVPVAPSTPPRATGAPRAVVPPPVPPPRTPDNPRRAAPVPPPSSPPKSQPAAEERVAAALARLRALRAQLAASPWPSVGVHAHSLAGAQGGAGGKSHTMPAVSTEADGLRAAAEALREKLERARPDDTSVGRAHVGLQRARGALERARAARTDAAVGSRWGDHN